MPSSGLPPNEARTHGPYEKISATFRFYAELNDFLSPDMRGCTVGTSYVVSPSVKDAIEALGVPHVEVDLVLINNRSVSFGERLKPGDRVAVYPSFQAFDITSVRRLARPPLRRPQFVADVHLRKLSRLLRLMGFDVLYSPSYEDPQLVEISVNSRRVLLTRDRALLKHGRLTRGYWVRSVHPRHQAAEVVRRFDLANEVRIFSRCPRCNGLLRPVAKEDVLPRIPPKTAAWIDQYVECATCGKLYWHGTHTDRIRTALDEILHDASDEETASRRAGCVGSRSDS